MMVEVSIIAVSSDRSDLRGQPNFPLVGDVPGAKGDTLIRYGYVLATEREKKILMFFFL